MLTMPSTGSLCAFHKRHPRRNPAEHQTRRQPTNFGCYHHRVVVSAEGTLGIDSFPAAPGVYLIRSVPS